MKRLLLTIIIVLIVGILYVMIWRTSNNRSQVTLDKNAKNSIKLTQTSQVKVSSSLRIYDEVVDNLVKDEEIPGGPITEVDIFYKGLNPKYNFTKSKEMIKRILGDPERVEEVKLLDTTFLTRRVENSVEYKEDPENVLMRTYYYSDFEVRVFILGNVESIHSIRLIGSSASTVRGIAVGDSNKKVVEKYGQGDYSVIVNESYHFYRSLVDNEPFGDHAVKIHLEDDIVKDIMIY